MMRIRISGPLLTLLLLLVAGAPGCAGHKPPASAAFRAGPIWSVADERFISEAAFIRAAAAADWVLLGERHDHPQHHLLQAQVLQALVAAGKRPVVAFEMLPENQQTAVDVYLTTYPGAISGLAEAIAWDQSGWPKWSLYAPVFETAVENRLPILAADIPTALQKELRTKGDEAIPLAWRLRYRLTDPLPAALQQELRDEIVRSHCGYANAEMVDVLTRFQRIRDAYLADRMLTASGQGVLIAGNGHVRTDRGVPLYLRAVAPAKQVVSLAFIEENDARRVGKDELPYDYVWYTTDLPQEDPCVKFKKSLERMRKHP